MATMARLTLRPKLTPTKPVRCQGKGQRSDARTCHRWVLDKCGLWVKTQLQYLVGDNKAILLYLTVVLFKGFSGLHIALWESDFWSSCRLQKTVLSFLRNVASSCTSMDHLTFCGKRVGKKTSQVSFARLQLADFFLREDLSQAFKRCGSLGESPSCDSRHFEKNQRPAETKRL